MVAAVVADAPLIVVAGPTASGKTSLALHLAQKFNGEIVSCDSVAVYREMEIGTAKPSREERAMIPHHLIDVVSPDESCTAGDYSRLAREALARHRRTRPSAHRRRRNRTLSSRTDRWTLPCPCATRRTARASPRNRRQTRRSVPASHPRAPRHNRSSSHPQQRRAKGSARHRGKPHRERAADHTVGKGPRCPHRLSYSAPWPGPSARTPLRPHQPARRRDVRSRIGRRDRATGRTLRLRVPPAHLTRLRRSSSRAARPIHTRRSHRAGPAGPSQLCQTPGHMVPPRTRYALAQRLRRRRRNSDGSEPISDEVDQEPARSLSCLKEKSARINCERLRRFER